jgi:hypothetical protein
VPGGLSGYFTRVLGPGLGWGGLIVGVLGLVRGVARRERAWIALVACVVPYYLGLAPLATQFPRYVLPLMMPLAVSVAGAWSALESWRLSVTARGAALAVLSALVLTPAAIGTIEYHREQARPSTTDLANRFIADSTGSHRPHVASELLALSLPTRRAANIMASAARLTAAQRRRILEGRAYDVDFIPMYTVQPEWSARYYDLRHFVAHDDVVITDAMRTRYLADTARFAVQVRFYRDLDRFGTLVARYVPGLSVRGPETRIYRLTPETGARLERERGPLDLTIPPGVPVHWPDELMFLEGMARAAYDKGLWAMAARYYRAMSDEGGSAMSEVDRLTLQRMLAVLEARSGHRDEAARLFTVYLAQVPDDTLARAALDSLRTKTPGPRRPRR